MEKLWDRREEVLESFSSFQSVLDHLEDSYFTACLEAKILLERELGASEKLIAKLEQTKESLQGGIPSDLA